MKKSVIADLSQGTLDAVQVVGGKLTLLNNPSVICDGVDDYGNIPFASNMNQAGAFTLEIKVKVLSTPQELGFVVGRGYNLSSIPYFIDVRSNKFTFGTFAGSTSNLVSPVSQTIALNTLYHVAGVYDGSNFKIYVVDQLTGGLVSNSLAKTISPDTANTRGITVGALDLNGANQRFNNMEFNEIRFWNVARSQSEISDNSDNELIGNESGLLHYWKANEGSGTVLNDSVAAAVNSSLVGALWRNPNYINWKNPDGSGVAISPVYDLSIA